MNFDDSRTRAYNSKRSSAVPAAFFTSLFTSAVVTITLLWLTGNLESLRSQQPTTASDAAKLRKVPTVTSLTPEVARDVLRSRDLLLVVREERFDNTIPKGKIIAQEPLADSDLKAGGAVKVTVSSGVEKIEIPNVVGKPLQEAKTLLEQKGIKIGKVDETGEGDPGVVTAVDPKVGVNVDANTDVTLTAAPSGQPIPKLVGLSFRKAKRLIIKSKFKLGKIRRRYDDNRNPNVVLTQEPAAESTAPPGTAIDLIIND